MSVDLSGFRQKIPHTYDERCDGVKVSYPYVSCKDKKRGHYLAVWIGPNVAKELDWKAGDRITFHIHERDKKQWWIRKAKASEPSYKLCSLKNRQILKICMVWKEFVPRESEMKIRKVSHQIKDKNLIIRSAETR